MDGARNIPTRDIQLSLRTKMLILVGAIAAILLVLLYALSKIILLDSFVALEEREVDQDTRRVIDTLQDELEDLSRITSGWSQRDETYQFIEDHNTAYIDSNLTNDTFTTFEISLMLFIDSSGELVYGVIFDSDTDMAITLTPAFVEAYLSSDSLLAHYGDYADAHGYVDGLVETPYGSLLLTVRQIRRSDGSGESRGTLVVGRRLDEARLAQLARVTAVGLELRYLSDPALPADFRIAAEKLDKESEVVTRKLSGDAFAGYTLINDISGQPVLILRVQTPRAIYHEGQETVWFFLLAAAVMALTLVIVAAGMIDRVVLARLARLGHAIRQIGKTGDMTTRVPVSGGDELADLGEYMNDMLAAFQLSQSALWSSETRYRALFENANDAIFLIRDDIFMDCNARALAMFGCVREQIIGQPLYLDRFSPVLQPDRRGSREKALDMINRAKSGKPQRFEWRYTRYDGTPCEADVTLNRLEWSGEVYVQAMMHDITERKRTEEALRASEEQYSTLFSRVPVNLYRTTPEGALIVANPSLLELLRYPDLETLQAGSVVKFYVDPADRERWRNEIEHEGVIRGFQMQLYCHDGTVIWVEDTARTIYDEQGNVLYYEGALKDISAHKQAEAERERLLQQSLIRASELATVAEISRQITTILDIEVLLWAITNLIRDNFNLYHVDIYLLEGDSLRLVAGSGEIGRQLVDYNLSFRVEFAHSLLTRAARTRTAVVINDVSQEPDYLSNPLLPRTRSEVVIPMLVGNELIGVLNVEDDKIDRFTTEDVNIQTALAGQVAIAIHNARLFTEGRRRLAIIENSNELVTLLDLDSEVPQYVNPAGVRLLGYDRSDEFLAQRLPELYPPEVLHQLAHEVLPTALAHGIWHGETILQRRDGSQFPAEQTMLVIRDKHGQPRDLAMILTDITQRKQAEQAMHKANRAYRMLSECNQAMVRASDENGLLHEICEIVMRTGQYHFVWVGYADSQPATVTHPVAHAGYEDGYLAAIRPPDRDPAHPGPCTTAIQSGQATIVHDIAADPIYERWRTAALERGYHSMIALPLRVDGSTFGALNVYAPEPNAFDGEEITLLGELADDLAYGIAALRTRLERQQALELLQQANAHLEQRNTQLLALHEAAQKLTATLDVHEICRVMYEEVARRLFGAQHFTVALYDPDTELITCDFSIVDDREMDVSIFPVMPLGSGPNSRTILTRQPQIVALPVGSTTSLPGTFIQTGDEREPQSALYVPLISGNTVIGVMNVQHYRPNAFQDADAKLLAIIANQAAAAIQNARLFAAERDQRRLAEALRDTAAAISQTLETDVVLDRILENIRGALPHDTANIMLIDGGMARIVRYAGFVERGLAEAVEGLSIALDDMPLLKTMLETGQPVIVGDVSADDKWVTLPGLEWMRSYIGAPILRSGQVLGLLNLDSATPHFFTQQHAERLQAFADQAAVAIRNAQLYTAEREQRVLAETLRDIAVTVNVSLDPDRVLKSILENIRRVVPNDAANIMLIEGDTARLVSGIGYAERGLDDWVYGLSFSLQDNRILKRIIETRQPVIIAETDHDPDWAYFEETAWQHSYACAPIMREDQVIGFLNVYSTLPGFFEPHHAERLHIFAYQMGIAIRNAQLFAAERDQRTLAEALRDTAAAVNSTLDFDDVLNRIMANIGHVTAYDTAHIMLIEDGIARVARSFPAVDDPVQQAWLGWVRFDMNETANLREIVRTGRTLVISDTANYPGWVDFPESRWIRSQVTVPIQHNEQLIGILTLDSGTPGFFSSAVADRLQAFADQAAMAMRNAQLYADERDQRIFAETLSHTATALTGALNLPDIAAHVLENIGRVVPHDAANLMLIDWESRSGTIIGCRGYDDHGGNDQKQRNRVPITNDVEDMPPGRSLVINDTHADSQWVDLPGDGWIRAYMGTPIHLHGEIIGMLNLDSATPGFFTSAHAARAQAFADQAALAIRSAQLFERVQRHAAELEQRVEERTLELEEQRAQLQTILDSMDEGVIYDEKLTVKYANRALMQLTGYTNVDFASHPYLEPLCRGLLSPEAMAALTLNIYDSVDRRGIWHGEVRLQRQDNSVFDAALTTTCVRGAGGAIIGAVTVIRDISREKALQEQKDRFIASASHELRTPLANIKTRLYLLQHQPEKADYHVSILNQVSDSMVELVENLLDVSRFERGVISLRRCETVLHDLIHRVVHVQQAEAEYKQITLITRLHPTPLRVHVDPQRMTQVITNLVGNAINYTPEGGQITIELAPEGGQAVMRIRDTGIGIAPDMLEQVFEPFFRADDKAAEGTGLGLTIAREIVHLHGGTIGIESEVGQGSVFTVRIDLLSE